MKFCCLSEILILFIKKTGTHLAGRTGGGKKKMCFFNKMALALFARYDIPPWRGSKRKCVSEGKGKVSDSRRVGGNRPVNRGQ